MDFSEAQKQGFIEAFIQIQTEISPNRTAEELRQAAEMLIKGCGEHYRAGVTRVSNISAVIPPDQKEEFKQVATSLTNSQSLSEFLEKVEYLLREFPLCKSWLEWWLRHGRILFPALAAMDLSQFYSLPYTTNAQESMHHKLYAQAGKHHDFYPGIQGLYRFALMYEEEFKATHSKHYAFQT